MGKSVQQKRQLDKSSEEIKDALKYALRQMKLSGSLVPGEETKVQAKVPASFWSWGETVDIHIQESQEVEMTSSCNLPFQFIDWGKNKANINKLFNHMDEFFKEGHQLQ